MGDENSSHWKKSPGGRARVLWVGLNWIGDTLMSMPAIQAWRRLHPSDELTVLVKPGLRDLWQLHAAPDSILTYEESPRGTFAAARVLHEHNFGTAYIAPNSFRTALLPFLARVPVRVGTRGHHRSFLLTTPVATLSAAGRHQSLEYYDLLGLLPPDRVEAPRLAISEGAREAVAPRFEGLPRPLVALMPGAARGPSKRWPVEHFETLAQTLVRESGAGLALFGGPGDAEACNRIATACGDNARSFAGSTTMRDWTAMLALCDAAVCNDSGGMHLAAAVGRPLVAVFGRTDPSVTGPLGGRSVIVQAEGGGRRDIARDDASAIAALAAIPPGRVFEALQPLLRESR